MSFFNNNCIGIVVLLFVRFLLVSCNSNAYSNTTRPINTDSTVTNTVTVTVSNSNRNINSNSSNYSGKQNGNSGSDNNQVAPTITNTSSTTNSISSSNNHNRQLLTNTTTGIRGAVVITLASSNKLAPYFEWTCRSFSSSGSLYDLLVFHEGNKALQTIKCARNVHLIDLKRNGLAKLIVSRLLDQQNVSKDVHFELRTILSEIILRCPRYLIEIKPLTGYLFKDYLQDYSHWTYSDPDIIWGNLDDWIDVQDIIDYDIVTVGKYMDAARLFLRGQFSLHKNNDRINNLWKGLEYFSYANFAKRLAIANQMLVQHKTTDEVFSKNFYSAEGWYSQVIFSINSESIHSNKLSDEVSIKLIGRGFNDFSPAPLVLLNGRLSGCDSQDTLTGCIAHIKQEKDNTTVYTIPKIHPKPAKSYFDVHACKMSWLPVATRYCIATPVYDKKVALAQDKQSQYKLSRVGEAMYKNGQWTVNNEKEAHRQFSNKGIFFHFRHWDDVLCKGYYSSWGDVDSGNLEGQAACMVLYMSHQKTLTFETCHDASSKEANNPQLLMGVSTTIDGSKTDPVDKLTRLRKEESVGKSNKHHVSHTDSGEENEKAQNKHISKGRMKAIKAKRREKALRGSQEN